MQERATLEHPGKDFKETIPLSPQNSYQKFTLQNQLAKQSIRKHRNKQESPKMGTQRKNLQSKGMEDSPLQELNEMEASKLSDTEFKRMVIRMLKKLTENYKELSRKYNSMKKEIEIINKNQEEMENTISGIKNTLEGITTRLGAAEH